MADDKSACDAHTPSDAESEPLVAQLEWPPWKGTVVMQSVSDAHALDMLLLMRTNRDVIPRETHYHLAYRPSISCTQTRETAAELAAIAERDNESWDFPMTCCERLNLA